MKNTLISVILPTYNGSKYISKSIESVLIQTYNNFELIIINDASTDNVEDIIFNYQKKDTRIIYIKNKLNLEKSKSKNLGVKYSKWVYISFIDDDDIWSDNEKLKKQVNFLIQNKNYWLVWTNAITINENNEQVWKIIVKNNDKDIRNNLLITNQFVHSSILMKKNLFLKLWWFNNNMNLCEDYDLWLRVWKITKMYNLSHFTIKYLIRNSSTTWKNYKKMQIISINLALKYKNNYPNYYISIIIRLITFFMPIQLINKIKKIYI